MDFIGEKGEMLTRLMSAAHRRGQVIANNIANQNTPGYKREVLRFEDLLADKLKRGGDWRDVVPTITKDLATPSSPDGNNVSLEVENNAGRENWVQYQLYATIMDSHFDLLRTVIQESR
jgi:flagellar basal-body rod protein FlgB